MKTVTREVPGAGGELIRVEDVGSPEGVPVLVHAGSPGSRRLFLPDVQVAVRDHGLRVLSYDRPGYSGRPRKEGRCVADAVEDVRCVAAALGVERLGMWGFSGGGLYALACAALLPEVVTGAAVFASFAPYGSPGLDFCEGWSDGSRQEVESFFSQPDLARAIWRKDTEAMYAALSTADGWMARWGAAAGTDDAHSREVAEHLAAEQRDCFVDGDDGWWDDWAAVLSPWGCDLADIRVPVRLWHGVRDKAVPIVHGRWLAEHVPGVVAHLVEAEDHTNIEHNNRGAACAWLAGLA